MAFKFGAITMVSGIIGVPLGTIIAEKLKKRSQRADPIICACGLILSAPLIAGSMLMITQNTTIAYILVFFGEVALNLNWAIVADILLVRFTNKQNHFRFRFILFFSSFILSVCWLQFNYLLFFVYFFLSFCFYLLPFVAIILYFVIIFFFQNFNFNHH